MLFTSLQFIAFVLILLVLYYVIPAKWQWIVLLAGNIYFYAQSGWGGFLFIITTILTTFATAIAIEAVQVRQKKFLKRHKELMTKEQQKEYKNKSKNRQKLYLVICLLINFGILAVLKYTNFIILNFTSLHTVDFLLPMGISFYTFQSMGYLIDTYRGKGAEHNIFRFALFVSFFPQLVQGPISRFSDLSKTLFEEHHFDSSRIMYAFERILWGYFKKMVIADRAAIGLGVIMKDTHTYYGAYALLGMILYAIDLYADFTGGIDITIGVANAFGIELAENFHRPFFSKNVAEYWRRWHITLCAWFKDYLFYPISMSKWMNKFGKKLKKTIGGRIAQRLPIYIATTIVWFVTGLWHGASWNFIVWGLLNCFCMLISQEFEKLYEKANNRLHYRKLRYYKVFEILRTTFIICSFQMLDYYKNVGDAFRMFFSIFTTGNYSEVIHNGMFQVGLSAADYIVLLVGVFVIFTISMLQRKGSVRASLHAKAYPVRFVILLAAFVAIIVFGAYGTGYEASQFIYNQF